MSTKELYDQKYFDDRRKGEQYRIKIRRMFNAIVPYDPKSVLDVGCGNGFLVKRLNESGFYAEGVDFSEYAGSEIPNKFTQCDAKKLPFEDKQFDLVVSADFLEHIPEEELGQVVSEMERVGNNVIAYVNYKKKGFYKDHTHVTFKTKEQWQKQFPRINIL